MAHVTNLTDGVLQATDGTEVLVANPTVGDAASTKGRDTEVYLHRGKMIPDGSGTREADQVPAEMTFTIMLVSDELADGVNWPSLLHWQQGESSAAITAAGWVSTQTRTGDTQRTLHYDWYPDGTASGAAYYRIPNALVIDTPPTDGRPNQIAVTVRSASHDMAQRLFIP